MGCGSANRANTVQNMKPICGKGHPLYWSSSEKAKYTCENCKKEVEGGDKFSCVICAYHICPKCGGEGGYAKSPAPSSVEDASSLPPLGSKAAAEAKAPETKEGKELKKQQTKKALDKILAKKKEKAAKTYTTQDYAQALADFNIDLSNPATIKEAYTCANTGAKECADDTTVDLNEFVQYVMDYIKSISGLLKVNIDDFTNMVQKEALKHDVNANGILEEKEFTNVYYKVFGIVLDKLAEGYITRRAAELRAVEADGAKIYKDDKRNKELAAKLKSQLADRQKFYDKAEAIIEKNNIDARTASISINEIRFTCRDLCSANGIPQLTIDHFREVISEISYNDKDFTKNQAANLSRILVFLSIETFIEA